MIETRAVLAGAYVQDSPTTTLTHAYDPVADRVLCRRVRGKSLADACATDTEEPPTCSICAKRDPRFAAR
jgi:hypothetical protein